MRRILYAGSELITGDAIADAVMALGRALADAREADTVTVPVLTDGRRTTATILIGPASQIVTMDAPPGTPELVDDDAVAALTTRRQRLQPVISAAHQSDSHLHWTDEI